MRESIPDAYDHAMMHAYQLTLAWCKPIMTFTMTKQTPFQKFEALAQQLIEGSFQRLLGGGLTLPDVAAELAKVVEDQAEDGWVPAQYDIGLNLADFEQIQQAEADAAAQLTNYLRNLVQQANLSMRGQPHIRLLADPAVSRHGLRVVAQKERPSAQNSTQIRHIPRMAAELTADIAALDAYLIIDGQRHLPLTKPLISLGRSVDNDIVLDAPTVSRQHAQIRWRYGRFILYDLSSRGRTQVNKQPVSETVLQSGDVISLSGIKLIYGEGDTQQRPRPRSANPLNDETQIRPPSTK
jgi:pSer/pThr/pTyr-binding forkhead associated (FHA) protein